MHIFSVVSPTVLSDSVIALAAFGLGTILSVNRLKNLSLLVRVSALLITMAHHYVQSHPGFKAKLSDEVKTELAKLHHEQVVIFHAPQSGESSGGLG